MRIGTALVLIAIGAILTFAVNVTADGFNINTIGVILMIVGGIGLLISLVVRHRLEPVLFDVSSADPATLAAATALFLGVAFIASVLPARRAAAVSPMEAMRETS